MASKPKTLVLDKQTVLMNRAIKKAVREALKQHKRAGNSIVIMRDGKIIRLKAKDIPV